MGVGVGAFADVDRNMFVVADWADSGSFAMTDKRMPVQMWAVMWKGTILEVYDTHDEAKMQLYTWSDRPNEATVEPVTVHFGHEIEGIRDAW